MSVNLTRNKFCKREENLRQSWEDTSQILEEEAKEDEWKKSTTSLLGGKGYASGSETTDNPEQEDPKQTSKQFTIFTVKLAPILLQPVAHHSDVTNESNSIGKEVSVLYETTVFADPKTPKSLDWSECSLTRLFTRAVPRITGAFMSTGTKGAPCLTNSDCLFDIQAPLKCYRPSCTCQKAKMQVIHSQNGTGHNDVIKIGYTGDFIEDDQSLPEDLLAPVASE